MAYNFDKSKKKCYFARSLQLKETHTIMAKEIQNLGIAHNVLASGSKIKGNITADSDFRIDGEVEGDIVCSGKVVIGTQGLLKGNLNCQNAEIMGRVNGKIVVSELLFLKETAKFMGDIKTKTLMIEPKAIFSGTCEMGQTVPTPQPKA